MNIAFSPEQSERLAQLIKRSGGTLAISLMNLLELSTVSDMHQVRQVEALWKLVQPHLAITHCDPHIVIDRENRLLAGGPLDGPHLDMELLRVFVVSPQVSDDRIDPRKLIEHTRGPAFEKMCNEFCKRSGGSGPLWEPIYN